VRSVECQSPLLRKMACLQMTQSGHRISVANG
jgi:hypothetical protein